MKVHHTCIPEVICIEPRVFGDDRGFFMETWRNSWLEELGIHHEFVQDNHSKSSRGTLRGLHYQIKQPQGKLVRVVSGEVFDVAVDMRENSPTFGRWVGEFLSSEIKKCFGYHPVLLMASWLHPKLLSLCISAPATMHLNTIEAFFGTIHKLELNGQLNPTAKYFCLKKMSAPLYLKMQIHLVS